MGIHLGLESLVFKLLNLLYPRGVVVVVVEGQGGKLTT